MVKPRKMHRTPSCSAASKALFGQAATGRKTLVA